jgi:hypothetical protein
MTSRQMRCMYLELKLLTISLQLTEPSKFTSDNMKGQFSGPFYEWLLNNTYFHRLD